MKLSLLAVIGLTACAATSDEVTEDSLAAQTEAPTYTNSFFRGADPGVVQVGSQYLMVTTSGSSPNALPARASTDLVTWRDVGPVLPKEKWPTWVKGDYWAPEIHKVRDLHVAFFSARSNLNGQPSVGVAWTKDLERWSRGELAWEAVTWKTAPAPLVTDDANGMIDPGFISDGDQDYVFFKRDLWTNKPDGVWRHECEIFVQPLAVDDEAVTLAPGTTRTMVLTIDRPWESDVVEAPFLVKRDGYFHMLYSANRYWEGKYVVSDARSKSVLGPWEKLGAPILKSNAAWKGPGHGSLVTKDGRDWFVYHAYEAGKVGDGHPRLVMLDPVAWKDGWPSIADGSPSSGPQPAP